MLILKYFWDCDSKYSHCGTEEDYYLTQRFGFVKYTNTNGVNQVYNTLAPNAIPINFPCF